MNKAELLPYAYAMWGLLLTMWAVHKVTGFDFEALFDKIIEKAVNCILVLLGIALYIFLICLFAKLVYITAQFSLTVLAIIL